VLNRREVSRRMLVLEAVGFLCIVAIIWLDEVLDLPHLFFGSVRTPIRPVEGIIETFFTIVVGLAVISITYRAFRRIEYLESLIVMCAWCRRVRSGNEWLSVEHFLERQHRSLTSHGICDSCAAGISLPAR